MEALERGRQLVEKCHPILLIEQIKTGREQLRAWPELICWQSTGPMRCSMSWTRG